MEKTIIQELGPALLWVETFAIKVLSEVKASLEHIVDEPDNIDVVFVARVSGVGVCLHVLASSSRVRSLADRRLWFLAFELIHAVFRLEVRFESFNLSGRSFGGYSFSGRNHLLYFFLNQLSL
jgi:hypothetical protein